MIAEQATAPAPATSSEPSEPRVPESALPARPTSDPIAEVLALSGDRSTSLAGPDRGTLQGGVQLPAAGPGFIANPRRSPDARFGTVELVQAIVRAAQDADPGGEAQPLVVNDLSLEAGGPIAQHGSHQNGRDADILFFLRDRAGRPQPSLGVPLDPEGTGFDFKDLADPRDDVFLRIDLPRTWRFVAALIRHGGDELQRIFIAEHLRTMLLAEAQRQHAPGALRSRFADISCQPGAPHDDHMHVRFYCTREDMQQGCLDRPPNYPFRLAALEAAGLTPRMAPPKTATQRKATRRRTTTPEEARRRAGPMHRDVVAFLDARKAWLHKTTPPRRYCR